VSISLYSKIKEALNVVGLNAILKKKISLDLENRLQQESTLCVHVRTGDMGSVSVSFKRTVQRLAAKFSTLIVFARVHHDARSVSLNTSSNTASKDIQEIIEDVFHMRKIVRHVSLNADLDLYLLSICSNLLIHRGGYSGLAALLNSGQVFYTRELETFINNPEYKGLLVSAMLADDYLSNVKQSGHAHSLSQSCCIFKERSESVICSNHGSLHNIGCWVLILSIYDVYLFSVPSEFEFCKLHLVYKESLNVSTTQPSRNSIGHICPSCFLDFHVLLGRINSITEVESRAPAYFLNTVPQFYFDVLLLPFPPDQVFATYPHEQIPDIRLMYERRAFTLVYSANSSNATGTTLFVRNVEQVNWMFV
jgi:hypothetical protein